MGSARSYTLVGLLLYGVFVGACAERVPIRQPIGESLVTSSAPRPPRQDATDPPDEPAAPSSCGVDQLPLIAFSDASTDLEERQIVDLRHLAECLTTAPLESTTVVLIGHTDVVGTGAANLALGLSRAQSVMRHLVDDGIPPARIVVASAGELQRPSARLGFRASRVEVLIARGGPTRVDEVPIARGIDAEGLMPPPRRAVAGGTPTATTAPPPSPPPRPAATARRRPSQ